ncbi:heme-binding protein [Thioalkalivibrio sp. HL-Eb18]|uniref:GlcG/HbpS family heme-binding protein n=1 Tax=Thioalkalivibrio sp. HL-Eb18 TaxID=1266913 RepID=UPI0003791735|nr:heme-binding protein [Thioalkalivibrio sp. HL-Eb18]
MSRSIKRLAAGTAAAACLGLASVAQADVFNQRMMSMELANDIAEAAVLACREKGHQTSAVVVDRAGNDRAVLRDNLAAVQTIQIAGDKARATVMSGTSSGNFRDNREDIRMEMNHVDGIIMLEGGLPIEVAGSMIGAVGVSGAPGGDLDEECAQAALDSVQERLDFAM